MVVRGRVRSPSRIRRTATQLRRIDWAALPDARRTAVDDALDPLAPQLAESAARLPSGYAPTMARAIRWATVGRRTVGDGRHTHQIVIYARGGVSLREVGRINAGVLRHPVFGRYRRTRTGMVANPWVTQAVRPGLASRPIAKLESRIYTHVDKRVRVVIATFHSGR